MIPPLRRGKCAGCLCRRFALLEFRTGEPLGDFGLSLLPSSGFDPVFYEVQEK